jgi:hypothetical protein
MRPAADKPKGVDWSWPGRIMPAKSGGREGTRPSDFGFSRQKTSNDKMSLSKEVAMNVFNVKSICYIFTTVGFLCLVSTSGCLVPPLPTKFYTNEDVLAVRCDAHSNVVERLVKKQSVMLHLDTGGMLICEGSGIAEKDFARRVYVDRTRAF